MSPFVKSQLLNERDFTDHKTSFNREFFVANDFTKVANKGKKINVLNANIRCLDAHFEDLQAFLTTSNLKPSLITVTETWLTKDSNEAVFNMEGYHKLITCNRSWGERGGVALYLSTDFQYRVLKKDTEREWLLVEILAPKKFLVGVSYRCARKFSEDSYCGWLLDELISLNKLEVDWIIAGDFNFDLLKETKHSVELVDVMKSVNLKLSSPLEPTRVFMNSKSCLDHIYSNVSVTFKTVYQTSITDHFFVLSELLVVADTKKTCIKFRDYKNLTRNDNLCKLNFFLKLQCNHLDWATIDLNDGFRKLAEFITFAAEKFAPMKPLLLSKKNWVTNKLKKNINKSDCKYMNRSKIPLMIVNAINSFYKETSQSN